MFNFEKKYEPKIQEKKILDFWNENDIYKFNKNSTKKIFSIDTPPPTISGKMHIGHAFSYTQTDFIARYKRMKGYEVFYPFGTDDNGLATEKLVQKERKVNLRKVKREEAIKIVNDFLKEEREKFIEDFQKIGLSCDFDLGYSTIDKQSQKISQKTFLDLYKKNLVYKKKGPIPWDRVFQTTIAQAELEDKEMKSKMNYIKAKIKDEKNTFIIYATTRPEMIFACHGFSIEEEGEYVKIKVGEENWILGSKTYKKVMENTNSNYKIIEKIKGKNLLKKKVIIPLINREIEITHDTSIKADLGTGCAYFCSYGGMEDIEYCKRHDPKIYEIINKDGTLNNLCGEFEGLIASENGRKKVIEKLKEIKVLVKQEEITHIVNVGERTGVEVEYITSTQWFVKYLDKKDLFLKKANELNWFPNFMKHRLENWIKGLKWDWGFSRQRHFGIPIPVWYGEKTKKVYIPKEDELPIDPTQTIPQSLKNVEEKLISEKDVFDTWFTSASTPILASNLIENEIIKKKLFPMNLRPQAHDIINFWLFYTIAKSNLLYEKNPFKDVNVSGWVLAPNGTKMSKSKGNTISPLSITEKYSNDALRFAASSTKLGQDIPFQEKEVQTGVKLVNKLYNAVKFAKTLLDDFTKEKKIKKENFNSLNSIDKWIIAKCQNIIIESNNSFKDYNFENAKRLWYDFFMRDVCDYYIEIVKERLWKKKRKLSFGTKNIILYFIRKYKKFGNNSSFHL